jgi:uncharacterized protein (DUF342 family)
MKKVILTGVLIMGTFTQAEVPPKKSTLSSIDSLKERVTLLEARLNQLESQLMTIKSYERTRPNSTTLDKQNKISKQKGAKK